MIWDCIIVGAGASGLYTASHLSLKNVLVLEKKHKPALKLGVSGNGQCNLTHDGYMSQFLNHYGPHKAFVKHALKAHDNKAVIDFFKSHDVELFTREDGKVFPRSLRAHEIITVLVRQVAFHKGYEIKYQEAVKSVDKQGDLFILSTGLRNYKTKRLVIATGGKSYPMLGSEGDGYAMAEAFKIPLTDLKPGLTGVESDNPIIGHLQGISFNNITVNHPRLKKQYQGDLLITHFGFSGPVIINNSRDFIAGDKLFAGLVDQSSEILTSEFLEAVKTDGSLPLSYFLNKLPITERHKQYLLKLLKIDGNIKLGEVSKQTRLLLVNSLTAFEIHIRALQGFDQAMVTVGGVSLDAVNPKTMATFSDPNLYFVGEVLDVDGDTGGYNLQWAFSSAYIAAKSMVF